ncbi:phospholipase A2 [Streptomyces sp. NPDC051569]|uniref:phospholipase A2 n=1 Tax=Streptomyces sp. NPDC051569 TaxID=3365661 RepID=UPI00378CA068
MEHVYDSAGRIVDAGYVYDGRHRLTATPDGLISSYYASDTLERQTAGDRRQSWTLDPEQRHRAALLESRTDDRWTSVGSQSFRYSDDGLTGAMDGTGKVSRTLLTTVDDLNGIASIDSEGTVAVKLKEISDEGQVSFIPRTGELVAQDFGVPASGSASGTAVGDLTDPTLGGQLTGTEVMTAPQGLALCFGCEAGPLSSTAKSKAAKNSPTGSRASATDYWLFDRGLWAFRDEKKRKGRRSDLVWTDDGCSAPWYTKMSATVRNYAKQFNMPCQRHDFGYRNYRKQNRNTTRARKDRIDTRFLYDMKKRICEPKLVSFPCNVAANGFHYGVSKFGDSAFF